MKEMDCKTFYEKDGYEYIDLEISLRRITYEALIRKEHREQCVCFKGGPRIEDYIEIVLDDWVIDNQEEKVLIQLKQQPTQ
jgi:hypothetical protein